MSARVAARWARFRGRRFVLVGALVAFGVVAGALALPSSSGLLAEAVAPVDPDAAAQGPNGAPHDKTLGGAPTVSREALEQAAAQAQAIHSAGGSWEYLGANNIGGRVTDVVVDPTQANTIYVASAGGGVWKSTDAGATYTTAWPNDYPQAIGSLARGSDGTLWAGTGEANASGGGITYVGDGVYRSTDGGQTWTNVGLEHAGMIGRIAVDPADPDVVLVAASGSIYSTGGTRGLYRTVDGGKHWKAVLVPDLDAAPYTGAVDVAIDPVNPNRVYATLWDHHRNSYLRPYGGIGSGLYVTDNALEKKADDVAWERIGNSHVSGPLPSYDASGSGLDVSTTLGRMGVAVAPSDHTRVYLITGESLGNDKGFFYSDNGDRPLADGGPTFVAGGHAGGNPRFEWWFGRLFVDPVNKNHLFKTDVSLRRSSDGGLTWVNVGGPARRPARDGLGSERAEPRVPRQRRRHVPLRRERRQRLDPRHEHAVAPGVPRCGLADAAESHRDRAPGQRLQPQLDEPERPGPRSGGRELELLRRRRRPLRRHRLRPTTRTTTRAARTPAAAASTTSPRPRRRSRRRRLSGATNVKVASVTGLVVGNTITIDSTGANPETVTMTAVGTQGAAGTGVSFTPALAFAHASGATVVKNGVTGTQSLGFGSRGSGLRCTTDAPLVQDPSSSTTLYLGCNNLSRSTNRGASWTQIAPPDLLTGPAPADDSAANNPLYAGQFPSVSTIAPSKSDPNTIYVGTDNGRLWRTTTLGVSWQEFPNPFAPDPPAG